MEREVNFYGPIHKAIRALLCSMVQQAGRTDFADEVEVQRLRRAFDEGIRFLSSHAAHEQDFVAPLLRRADPEVARALEGEHREQERQLAELSALVEEAARDSRRGHAVVLAVSRLAGELLTHMADEEEQAMPALRRAVPAEDLDRTHRELLASIPPEDLMHELAWMLPAISPPERLEMLRGARAGAPAAFFDSLLGLARRVLPADDAQALFRGLEEERVA